MKGSVAEILLLVLAAALLFANPGEAVSCEDIQSSLTPCLAYLTGTAYLTGEGEPTDSCCSGVKSVQGSLQSKGDRQTACECMKSAASSYGVKSDAASSLAWKCGVSVGVSISPNTDCSQAYPTDRSFSPARAP